MMGYGQLPWEVAALRWKETCAMDEKIVLVAEFSPVFHAHWDERRYSSD
jgi:hypothetical protein